ncbi:hypothetical protein DEO72_LG4g1703 [Vigna unguiculata]|uniref:Uncharacterized protein n=1 Tax=Vigna unguiculata TaxID=3917 RepID=A0A4D6LQH8_VIGUN|nr:hypothetical protein DEO72_LG4g1703 [Vigna unguiculata]
MAMASPSILHHSTLSSQTTPVVDSLESSTMKQPSIPRLTKLCLLSLIVSQMNEFDSFTGTTGDLVETHDILSWSFNSFI